MNGYAAAQIRQRFRNVPSKIVVPLLHEDEDSNSVEVDLDALNDDPTELCLLLEAERTSHINWIIIALAYVQRGKTDEAIEIMTKGLEAPSVRSDRSESVPLQSCLLWLYLHKARQAIRGPFNPGERHEERTKDYYLQQATTLLNQLSRFDPDHPAYVMGRAVYSSLKAAITSSKQEKQSNWDLATKLYDDALKRSQNSNMFALMGRARMLFHKRKYDKALESYQEVLLRRPDMDPDPRIGIGLCFWMLGFKDDAKGAWQRALELDPESKIANILLGVYHLSFTSGLSEHDESFVVHYKKAMNEFTQRAYKKDKELPLACTMFASYFFSAGGWGNVEVLAKKAIEFSDVGQVASDAYYLLGRTCQQRKEYDMARQYYARSENSRDDGIYLPAKVGLGQLHILAKDMNGAKFIFENLLKTNKHCLEAMVILGTLYAMEVFDAATSTVSPKPDKSAERSKAINYLDQVRKSWKDPKRHMAPNPAVLLTLARLYEEEPGGPEKALGCLQQVADIEKETSEDEELLLSPRLLNNMAVFHYIAGRYDEARELFQTAMNNGKALMDKGEITDFESILATMTYNLARLEEASGNDDEAVKYYEQVLSRQKDYVEASMRLAYLALKKGNEEGAKKLDELMKTNDYNLELCSMYGWHLSRKPKKTPLNIAEDKEQRHYKRTLQNYDKHDRYSLTGMGNLHLMTAREMRRDTEQDKEKRRKVYERAVEFFDKALQLDPKNAYAAQGIAIALVEDRKDFNQAVQIFSRVRETLRDASVYINLGHCLAELKQYTRAIENYETAIKQYGAGADPWILTCLGRVHLSKGKAEQSIESLNKALQFAKEALSLQPELPIYKFNVAFVQVQICSLVHSLPQTKRSAKDIQAALDGLEEAIQTFTDVAKSKNPPYPAADIEQRSTMGKNTTRKQLKTVLEAQLKYEEANAAKLAEAKRLREEEAEKRRTEAERQEQKKEEDRRRLAREREEMRKQAEQWAQEKRSQMEVEKEEAERKATRRKEGGSSRSKRTKKSGDKDIDSADDDTPGEDSRAKKRRRIVSKKEQNMKSTDYIEDSDDLLSSEDDMVVKPSKDKSGSPSMSRSTSPAPAASSSKTKAIIDSDDDDLDDGDEPVRTRRPRRIADDDEDEDMDDE